MKTWTKRAQTVRNLARVTLPGGVTKLARVDRSLTGLTITTDDRFPEVFRTEVSRFQRRHFLSGDGIELRPINAHTGYRVRMIVRKLSTAGLVKVPEVMFHE